MLNIEINTDTMVSSRHLWMGQKSEEYTTPNIPPSELPRCVDTGRTRRLSWRWHRSLSLGGIGVRVCKENYRISGNYIERSFIVSISVRSGVVAK